MITKKIKKVSFLLLASGIVLLPGCWWRKNKGVSSPIIVHPKNDIIDVPLTNNYEKTLVFDNAIEELFLEDEPCSLAQNTASIGTESLDEINLEEVDANDTTALVYFPYDKELPGPDQGENLKVAAAKAQEILKEGKKIVIKGHACEWGARCRVRNLPLSMKRAQWMAEHLVKNANIPAESIKIFGVGSEEPVSLEHSKKAQSANRRVELYGLAA